MQKTMKVAVLLLGFLVFCSAGFTEHLRIPMKFIDRANAYKPFQWEHIEEIAGLLAVPVTPQQWWNELGGSTFSKVFITNEGDILAGLYKLSGTDLRGLARFGENFSELITVTYFDNTTNRYYVNSRDKTAVFNATTCKPIITDLRAYFKKNFRVGKSLPQYMLDEVQLLGDVSALFDENARFLFAIGEMFLIPEAVLAFLLEYNQLPN